ncbi:MAG: hypothetical protein DI537_34685 [Stutzerimonas stutzeri]|nr:MAG: hypothetical protein DI537_34685 [Stutzerimonas stutzeri]
MAQGLQVWDASGTLIFDTGAALFRELGAVSIGSGNNSGSVTDAGFAEGLSMWFIIGAQLDNYPDISFSGTTLTWSANGTPFSGTLYYGTY